MKLIIFLTIAALGSLAFAQSGSPVDDFEGSKMTFSVGWTMPNKYKEVYWLTGSQVGATKDYECKEINDGKTPSSGTVKSEAWSVGDSFHNPRYQIDPGPTSLWQEFQVTPVEVDQDFRCSIAASSDDTDYTYPEAIPVPIEAGSEFKFIRADKIETHSCTIDGKKLTESKVNEVGSCYLGGVLSDWSNSNTGAYETSYQRTCTRSGQDLQSINRPVQTHYLVYFSYKSKLKYRGRPIEQFLTVECMGKNVAKVNLFDAVQKSLMDNLKINLTK
jgi:hypothetical protein